MKKFRVYASQSTIYYLDVEAETETDAMWKAKREFDSNDFEEEGLDDDWNIYAAVEQ